jgi:hypothetical protein
LPVHDSPRGPDICRFTVGDARLHVRPIDGFTEAESGIVPVKPF